MMRVALFSGNYNHVRDGANQALNRLVALLLERGHAARVYSPVSERPAFEPAGTLIAVPSFPFPGRSDYRVAPMLPPKARQDLWDFSPDLIHLSSPDGLGFGAQRFARQNGIPTVASLHTRFETYFGYYGLGFVRGRVERRLDRFYRGSDHILVPTAAIQHEFGQRYGANRVSLWSRGVDSSLFCPERRSEAVRASNGLSEDAIAVLFLGRLVKEKGTEIYAGVMRQLSETGLPFRPVIIGAGPEEAHLRSRLPDAIFKGHLDGEQLATEIGSCDILLNPSRTEAFGNVLLEALASGLMVVAADTQSSRNLLGDQIYGIMCDAEDVNAYASAIRDAAFRVRRRDELRLKGRTRALAFRWTDACEPVLAAYRDLTLQKNGTEDR